MNSAPGEEQDQEQARQVFLTEMKSRLEQAQASGQTPEQIQELASTYARAEIRRQAPQIVAKVHSWWIGFRRFVTVGALAFGFAIGLALFVEHQYAAPLCERYASQHGLTYQGIYYPVIGKSSSTTSSGSCLFSNASGQQSTVLLRKVEPNQVAALLISFALQIDVITPTAFILIALIAVKVFKFK